MKKLQFFLNRHYDSIKLVSIFVIAIICLLILHSVKESTDTLITDSAQQTEEISRQLTATCVILIETVPSDTLAEIDPPLENRCKDLASEAKREAERNSQEREQTPPDTTNQPQNQPLTQPDTQATLPESEPSPEAVEPQTARVTPKPVTPQQEALEQPEEPTILGQALESVTSLTDNVIEGINIWQTD